MEKYNEQFSITPETSSSREMVIIKNLKEKNADLDTLSEEAVRSLLSKNKKMEKFELDPNDVIAEMKDLGYFKESVVEEVKKETGPVEPVVISNRVQLKRVSEFDNEKYDELLEQNHFFEELAGNIFKNEHDLQEVYDQTLALEKDHSMETPEYYMAFAGLVRGGAVEVKEDLEELAVKLKLFKDELDALPSEDAARAEKMKKVATIVERAIIYAVTTVGWYGEGISIEQASNFDDVKRGVDGVLQIRREGDKDTFLALGIDATYRGLLSKEYRNKFSKLLESIWKNQKTKIKYFKNHQGELMKEFDAPKIVLYFDNKDVKNLINLVKNSNDPEAIKKFKNNPQKITTMNQILVQCQILSEFAKEYKNNISDKYDEFIEAIHRLGKKDPEIQAMIDSSHENDVTHHMRYLVKEFKKLKRL